MSGQLVGILARLLKEQRQFRIPACLKCDKPTVGSHTISRNVLKRIANKQSRVIVLGNQIKDRSPRLMARLRPISRVLLFWLLCLEHDQDFMTADNIDLNLLFTNLYKNGRPEPEEMKSLFLWGYRAVLRELWAKMFQANYMSNVLRSPAPVEVKAFTQQILESAESFESYALRWHQLFVAENWTGIRVHCLRLVGARSVAASGCFSLDAIVPFHPGSATVSVIPSSSRDNTIVIYSALPDDLEDMDAYLQESGIFWQQSEVTTNELRQRISCQLLRDVESFAVSPEYWKRIPMGTRKAMKLFFQQTVFSGLPIRSDLGFNLFEEYDQNDKERSRDW